MSEKNPWPVKPTCCMGCEKRKPGCHDVKKCAAWAEQVQKRQADKAAREAARPVVRRLKPDRRVI